MKLLKKIFLFTIVVCSLSNTIAQTVDNTLTPEQLVQQVFLGQGVSVSNVTFQGDQVQIGKFFGFTSFGIDSGIILSSGRAVDMASPAFNNASFSVQNANSIPFDQDIQTLLNNNPNSSSAPANDNAILEFDFIPLGDSVRFDYVFGSEEYPEFVCSFNDAFGMFLSGPGITGPYSNNSTNIALIPGTTDNVSIYNINPSGQPCTWSGNNSNLYNDNTGNPEFVFDGYTVVLRAEAQVVCGQTYHLKIAICDAGDRVYDSGVMLKARSLVSNQISLEALSPGGDSTLAEGCASGQFVFFRPGVLTDTLTVDVTYSGTATMGVDFNNLPSTITFLPGESIVSIDVIPTSDGVLEGFESITASITQETCDGTAFNTISQTFWIIEPQPIQVQLLNQTACPGDAVTLTPILSGGYFPITYLWSTGETTQTITVTPGQTESYTVIVSDGCSNTVDTATATITIGNLVEVYPSFQVNQVLEACGNTVLSFNLLQPLPDPYTLDVTIGGLATNGTDYVTLPNQITFPAGITTLNFNVNIIPDALTEGDETITITINLSSSCQVFSETAILTIIDANAPPAVSISQQGTQTCPGDAIVLVANGTGGTGNYTFNWVGGPANETTFNINPSVNTTYTVQMADTVCGETIVTTASLEIVVPAINPVNIPPIAPATRICPGSQVGFSVAPSQTGNSLFSYSWQPGGFNTQSISVNPNETTTYTVVVTGQCGATNTSSVTVTIPEVLPFQFSLSNDKTVRCIGDTALATLYTSGGYPGLKYSWNGSPFSTINPFSVTVDSDIDVIWVGVDTCGNTFRDTLRYKIPNYLPLVVSAGPDTSACPNSLAPLSVSAEFASGLYSFLWSAISGTDAITSVNTDTSSVRVTGTHLYRIVVTDVCGESISDTVEVRLRDCEIEIPNVFTPNGDAVNNRFIISGIKEYPNTNVLIYDRWGKKVYENTNYSDDTAWDGDGVDTGTYFYVVIFANQNIKSRTGTLQLLR